ncbi:Mitochondrial respiratory supercomplex factor 1 [Lachnellula arida]|uniref:Mitochondrial respiratory supercomplex factor 1 n=1 Tax=Lachnellula arida TaxID=1316785 RepID=A0A8T9AZ57_9HELO|nr:Mitochondrial respiratory supercomplex factor 1 [Lachnellula arida]
MPSNTPSPHLSMETRISTPLYYTTDTKPLVPDSDFYEENRWQKLSRRLKEEPLIPLGCALTCAALVGATRSIRAGDQHRTNRMFRARIAAQAFTLVAMVAGSMYWDSDRKKRKEFEGAIEERKAKEKNEAWIKELEARDEEEKAIRAQRERRRLRQEGRAQKVEEKVTEKGQGVLDRVYGLVGGAKSDEEKAEKTEKTEKTEKVDKVGTPPKASSMVDERERRKLGVLEMCQHLLNSRR